MMENIEKSTDVLETLKDDLDNPLTTDIKDITIKPETYYRVCETDDETDE